MVSSFFLAAKALGMANAKPPPRERDELATAIARIGDDDVLRAVLGKMQRLTGMKFAAIAFVSEERWIASLVSDDLDFGLAAGDELDVRTTICDQVRSCSSEVLIDDVASDPAWSNHPVPQMYGFRSYLSIPILVGSAFFGTLCAIDTDPREQSLAELRGALLELAAETGRLLMERMRRDVGSKSMLV